MKPDKYTLAVDQLLRQMAELERRASLAEAEEERRQVGRCLEHCHKRFEYLIPFPFRMELRRLCRDAGVQGNFT
ncbi:MAG: hypothetical protein EAZ89_00090 [Bacteroidetes bacterium]|nr:MAG: hypothetical protein EAZ89_00090 [Bacteroidota bacterium]